MPPAAPGNTCTGSSPCATTYHERNGKYKYSENAIAMAAHPHRRNRHDGLRDASTQPSTSAGAIQIAFGCDATPRPNSAHAPANASGAPVRIQRKKQTNANAAHVTATTWASARTACDHTISSNANHQAAAIATGGQAANSNATR